MNMTATFDLLTQKIKILHNTISNITLQVITPRIKHEIKKRKNQIKSACTNSLDDVNEDYCDENYWSKRSKKELIKDESRYNQKTEAGDYLPNEFDGSCGGSSKFGQIVGGEDSKLGEFPFVAALGTNGLLV